MKRIAKNFFCLLMSVLIVIAAESPIFAKIDKDTLLFYSKNNILYYDPSGTSCLPGSSAITVSGNSQEEFVWNYFVETKIDGVYNDAAVIAGIMGNLQTESGFDPFLDDGSVTGVFQASSDSFQKVKTTINNTIPGAASLWWESPSGTGRTYSGEELEKAKQALKIELDYMTGNDGNKEYYQSQFKQFIKTLDKVSKTPESYAELFSVWVEGNVADNSCVSHSLYDPHPIVDPSVQNIANTKYKNNPACQNVPYQGLASRRENAKTYYEKYSSSTINSIGGSSDGSTVTIIGDSITFASADAIREKLPQADIAAGVGMPFGVGINIAKDPTDDTSYKFDKYTSNLGKLKEPLRQNVIFALGTNNSAPTLKEKDIQDSIAAIGTDKNIYFVTNYSKDETANALASNSQLLKKSAEANSNVHIIDWAAAAAQGDYLEPDQLHPNTEGQKLFADLIYQAFTTTTSTSICNPSGSGSATPWDGEIPWYNQCGTDNEGRSYMSTKVSTSGYPSSSGYVVCHSACGVFSMASILTVLTRTKVDPEILLDEVGKDGRFSDYGTNFESLGTYKRLYPQMTSEIISKEKYNENQYIARINKALDEGKMIWIAGNEDPKHINTPFSPNGHFVAIRGRDASGNWLVIDPNGTNGKDNTFNKSFSPSVLYKHVQKEATAIIGI